MASTSKPSGKPTSKPASKIETPAGPAPAAGKPIWDHMADKELLCALVDSCSETGAKIDWSDVASRMAARGLAFSKQGCYQHVYKMRKGAAAGASIGKSGCPLRFVS